MVRSVAWCLLRSRSCRTCAGHSAFSARCVDELLDHAATEYCVIGPLGMPLHAKVEAPLAVRCSDGFDDAIRRAGDRAQCSRISNRLPVVTEHLPMAKFTGDWMQHTSPML